MPTRTLARVACAIMLVVTAAAVQAKDVTLNHQGLALNANLELAAGKKPADGVILITHGALGHRRMEIVTSLQKLFKERGYSTLAINLSLGLSNRHGMYDCKVPHRHRYTDAADEIGVWVDWLKKQGVTRVAVLGHSRGGAQTAVYAAERDNALVKAVVLLAPAIGENTDAATYQQRFRQPLAPLLEKAQQLVKGGKGGTVIEHIGLLTCNDTSASADSFVSYYGPDPRLDTPHLLPKIRQPVFVVVASKDNVVVDLDKKVAPLADGKRVRMIVIDGANHLFHGFAIEDTVDAAVTFLKAAGY